MKVLYAIQGTGNGHISRAKEIVPRLGAFSEFDLLISGRQFEVNPDFEPRFSLNGLSLHYTRNGGIDFVATFRKNSFRNFLHEVKSLPVEEYDLVINDFEPVSAWACRMKGVPCISLSHQASFLDKSVPKASRFFHPAELILRFFAPAKDRFGFHFKAYGEQVFGPLIRSDIRALQPADHGHYLVYLPAYSPVKLLRILRSFSSCRFEVFSRGLDKTRQCGHVQFHPIGSSNFEEKLRTSAGVICSAGFELPSESLFLGKKLLVIPIKGQYEQACNARGLKDLGVAVISELRTTQLGLWLKHGESIKLEFKDEVDQVLRQLFESYLAQQAVSYRGTSGETSLSESILRSYPG